VHAFHPVGTDSISTSLAFSLVCPEEPRGPVPDPAAITSDCPSGVEVVSLGRLKADLTPIAHIRIETTAEYRDRGCGGLVLGSQQVFASSYYTSCAPTKQRRV
jgi:hypothetical protein